MSQLYWQVWYIVQLSIIFRRTIIKILSTMLAGVFNKTFEFIILETGENLWVWVGSKQLIVFDLDLLVRKQKSSAKTRQVHINSVTHGNQLPRPRYNNTKNNNGLNNSTYKKSLTTTTICFYISAQHNYFTNTVYYCPIVM